MKRLWIPAQQTAGMTDNRVKEVIKQRVMYNGINMIIIKRCSPVRLSGRIK